MSWLASLVLALVHALYALSVRFRSSRASSKRTHTPHELTAPRQKKPKHLGLILAYDDRHSCDDGERMEDTLVECVKRAARYAQVAGIQELTVYDRDGILVKSSSAVRDALYPLPPQPKQHTLKRSELIYPLTPPLSDDSDSSSSRSLPISYTTTRFSVVTICPGSEEKQRKSAKGKRRRNDRSNAAVVKETMSSSFTINLVSRESGKPAIAIATNELRRNWDSRVPHDPSSPSIELSVPELEHILEGEHGFAPPDLIIAHHITSEKFFDSPLELYGFPPWQVRLSEIYHSHSPPSALLWRWPWTSKKALHQHRNKHSYAVLEELDFRRALDEFSGAEFRLGR